VEIVTEVTKAEVVKVEEVEQEIWKFTPEELKQLIFLRVAGYSQPYQSAAWRIWEGLAYQARVIRQEQAENK